MKIINICDKDSEIYINYIKYGIQKGVLYPLNNYYLVSSIKLEILTVLHAVYNDLLIDCLTDKFIYLFSYWLINY